MCHDAVYYTHLTVASFFLVAVSVVAVGIDNDDLFYVDCFVFAVFVFLLTGLMNI